VTATGPAIPVRTGKPKEAGQGVVCALATSVRSQHWHLSTSLTTTSRDAKNFDMGARIGLGGELA
jgi:hypothetical protein